MNVAIIPARSGSKRIPNKNIKNFHGRPLISYSIEVAIQSKLFDKIIVSTDSEEIAKVAKKYGAEVPFFRPKKLSDDFTPTSPVIFHTLDWLRQKNIKVDYACCIYATCPLLDAKFLKQGFKIIKTQNTKSVFSVTNFEFPIFRGLKIDDKGKISMLWPKNKESQRLKE